ncbi:helix-turn-helix domain-containing protein [Pedobacter alluvionis]|uniref:DNA-binding protein n=1 Tax=Pedobacter alluvionis TaxID=475253 RepID=A0A497XY85_9SPHI|nr:helix-turn-helix domain-containing protein [Pedobacter alluvionis]RLJ75081.1 excisionase family DNA binding protein [Pedobacter alluvionis]TFB30191.1 DNA-binding protein [Pedobacter alluvionis]
MKEYSFEQLPKFMARMEEKLDRIEVLLETYQKDLPENDFIGAKEACEILKFTLPTLYTKVCKREVPFYKQGNRLYFSRVELLNWIQEGKKKSLSEINSSAIEIAKKMGKRNRY